MKKLILIAILFYASFSYSQSGWYWQNPLPQGSSLNCIKFVNSQTGIAVGNAGAILKTSDAGESWNLYLSNFLNDLNSLTFTDENTLYAVGTDGKIIQTTDCGVLWNNVPTGITDSLNSVYFTDVNTGYIAGSNGKIFKSTDRGINWTQIYSGGNIKLNCVYFVNSNIGYVCGDNSKFLRTTNAGNNWISSLVGINNNAIHFLNSQTGFLAGGSSGFRELRRTTNGGLTWIQIFVSASAGELRSIQFIDQMKGFACGINNTFIKTTDGGSSWTLDNTITGSGFGLLSVDFRNQNEGYLAGSYGTIFKSTDQGIFWTQETPHGTYESFTDVSFPSNNTGYISSVDNIYKTIDGNNWIDLNVTFNNIFTSKFLTNNIGYAQSLPGYKRTTDGGLNWTSLSILPNSDTVFIEQIMDENTLFGLSSYGSDILYKSSDRGDNWIPIITPVQYVIFHNIYFINTNTGYYQASDSLYSVFKTTNGGNNWSHNGNLFTNDTLIPIYSNLNFINENTGLILLWVTDSFERQFSILRTTNAGANWNVVYSVYTPILTQIFPKIKIADLNNVYFFPCTDFYIKSTNGGANWFKEKVTDIPVYDIDYANQSTGYMVGAAGMIKKTTTGGVIAVENNITSIPENFILSQNYPNPFNPKTIIKYSVASDVRGQTSNVVLKVYNILGKEVKTLVNENKVTGSYEVEFDGTNLPSGIYFYKITAGDFNVTKKMVLIK